MKKIVTLSGGSGGFILLRGLAEYPIDITSIATVFDSGGSTGILRDAYGALPQGDLRRCLLALIPNNSKWREPFMHRPKGKGFLKDHPLGNLMLFAFEKIYGRADASRVLGELLHANGTVLPVSTDDAHLVATLSDGSEIFTEAVIDGRKAVDCNEIVSIRLDRPATATEGVISAINNADYIIIGPGDVYTSLIPNLLADGVTAAINESTSPLIYVANLMTKGGETRGYSLERFLDAFYKHGITRPFSYVIHTRDPVEPNLLCKYWEDDSAEKVSSSGAMMLIDYCERYYLAPLQSGHAANNGIVRHSPHKLGRALMNIIGGQHTSQILIIDLDDTLLQTSSSDKKYPGIVEKIPLTPGAIEFLHSYPGERIVLTAGDYKLQKKKIDLSELNRFIDKFHVVTSQEAKQEMMRKIVGRSSNPSNVLVIGDRVDSELHYGSMLGCTVVRVRLSEGKYAKQLIHLGDKISSTVDDFTQLMHLCILK